jgi:uncharacterized protein (AIM24 family)
MMKFTSNTNDNSSMKEHLVFEASGWTPLDVTEGPNHKFAITGNESQIVTVSLEPGETCHGEPSSMMYLTPNVNMVAKCEGCWSRCLSGESCCVLHFTNHSASVKGYAALVSNDPLAKIVPVDLASPDVGGVLIVQQGSYLASYGDVTVGISCDCNFCRCCCGGMGLVRQKLFGDGTAFLGATGTIVQKVLAQVRTITHYTLHTTHTSIRRQLKWLFP